MGSPGQREKAMEPKISELQTQRLQLLKDAEALADKAGATAEELAQSDAKITEAEALEAKIKTLQSQEHRKKRIEAGKLASQPSTPAAIAAISGASLPGGDGASLSDKLPAIPKS